MAELNPSTLAPAPVASSTPPAASPPSTPALSASGSGGLLNAEQILHLKAIAGGTPLATLSATILDLKKHLKDLSFAKQTLFYDALNEQMTRIGGLRTSIMTRNGAFATEAALLTQPEYRAHWRGVREKDKENYKAIADSVKDLKGVFDDRIKELQNTIRNHRIEMAIFHEAMVGKSTAVGWEAYRGAAYLINEINTNLTTRRTTLGIGVHETAPPEADVPKSSTSDTVRKDLADLSKNLACLEQDTCIVYYALKFAPEAANTDWPRLLYLHQSSRLKEYHDQWEGIPAKEGVEAKKGLKAQIEERLKAIPTAIAEEGKKDKDKQDASLISDLKIESAELTKRRELCEANEKAAKENLEHLRYQFTLKEYQFKNEGEEVEFDDLSETYSKVFNLLASLTTFREGLVIGDGASQLMEIPGRKVAYFRDCKALMPIEADRALLKDRMVPDRTKLLESAILTYQNFIARIELGKKDIDHYFGLLTTEEGKRATWAVDEPKPVEVKAASLPSSPQVAAKVETPKTDLKASGSVPATAAAAPATATVAAATPPVAPVPAATPTAAPAAEAAAVAVNEKKADAGSAATATTPAAAPAADASAQAVPQTAPAPAATTTATPVSAATTTAEPAKV